MNRTLEECRWLYNQLLEQRKTVYEDKGQTLRLYDQTAAIVPLKEAHTSLKSVNAQVLQNVAVRLDLAMRAFFRRVRAGEKPGYPRFKGYGRYDSFTFPQAPSGCRLLGDFLQLAKIGQVRCIVHRPLQGKPKTCTIVRCADKWYAVFSCEFSDQEKSEKVLPEGTEQVGIDVGLKEFAFLSTGESIGNPKFYRRDEKDLKRMQRRVSREEKGSAKRKKAIRAIQKVHARISNRRKDFVHQHSRRIVNRFSLIAVEDIRVNRMVHNHCLAKSIMDAAWSLFFSCLAYKAEEAGRKFVQVNPAYTSQDCHKCGHRQKMSLSERMYSCPCCGMACDRDHNASLNILRLGLQSVGIQSIEAAGLTRAE
jgi:putative transposase